MFWPRVQLMAFASFLAVAVAQSASDAEAEVGVCAEVVTLPGKMEQHEGVTKNILLGDNPPPAELSEISAMRVQMLHAESPKSKTNEFL